MQIIRDRSTDEILLCQLIILVLECRVNREMYEGKQEGASRVQNRFCYITSFWQFQKFCVDYLYCVQMTRYIDSEKQQMDSLLAYLWENQHLVAVVESLRS